RDLADGELSARDEPQDLAPARLAERRKRVHFSSVSVNLRTCKRPRYRFTTQSRPYRPFTSHTARESLTAKTTCGELEMTLTIERVHRPSSRGEDARPGLRRHRPADPQAVQPRSPLRGEKGGGVPPFDWDRRHLLLGPGDRVLHLQLASVRSGTELRLLLHRL